MTNRNLYNSIFLIACLFFPVLLTAQSPVAVKVTIDRRQILIGEPIRLTLVADIPESQPIRFFQLDSIPHFEFLEKEKIDTANTPGGTVLSQQIRITSFDSGHWVLPSFVLYEGTATDTIGIDVGFSAFDPQQPYHDIKDIIEVPEEKNKKQWWRWYVAGGLLLLLLAGLFIWSRRKKPVVQVIAPPVDPYKTAIAQLEKLWVEKDDPKQYYSRLADIFRVYVFARKGIHSLQKTTDDLVIQLRDTGLSKEQFERLSQALRLSDFVKFARYIPSPEDDRAAWDTIKASVDAIEQLK